MRTLVVLSVFAMSLFAGCIAGEDTDLSSADDDAARLAGLDVTAFRPLAGNVSLAADAALGTPWWKETGFGGAEPTMGITSSGAIFATGGSSAIRSLDGGGSWEVSYDLTPWSFDPMMWYDEVTDLIYMDPMTVPLGCTTLAWSGDDGESWTTNPAVCHPPPMDHQKFFTGVPGPEAPPVAGVAHPTVLYQCYNQIVATQCGVSYDGGMTWPVTTKVAAEATDGGCGGTNGHGATSPKGVVAVPVSSCDELGLGFSHDSGLSFDFTKVPGGLGVRSFDPDLVFDDEERLFALWRGDDHRTYLTTTPDYGGAWTEPVDVTPPLVQSTFFHTMNLGAGDRLAMAFLGTEDWDGNPNDAPEDTRWHLYILTTEERYAEDPVFTSYKVTPDDDPVHVGQICTGGISCTTGRELLEFIDSAVSPDGTFHVIYTDSCTGDCAEKESPTESDKSGRQLVLARLDGFAMVEDLPASIGTNVTAPLAPSFV